MQSKKYILCFIVTALTGCGTADIAKRTDDTYTVSSQYGSLNGSWDRAAREVIDKATVFCEGRKEKVILIDERRDGVYGFSPQRVDLVFKCTADVASAKNTNTQEERLYSARMLFEKGLITEAQYNEQVKNILK